MVAYGSVALTREQQQKHYIKSQVILGMSTIPILTSPICAIAAAMRLPTLPSRNHISSAPFNAPVIIMLISTGDLPSDTKWPGRKEGEEPPQFEAGFEKAQKDAADRAEAERQNAINYPLSKRDRISRDEFAARLREAERMHGEEEAAKEARRRA